MRTAAFLIVLLLFIAYGILSAFWPEQHLAFNAWLSRRNRRQWHQYRAYTTPGLRMERRWSQQTPASLRRIRITGIAFLGMSLWVLWQYLKHSF